MVKKSIEKNDDIINYIEELYSGHGSFITTSSQFLGYGILIALFHFGRDEFFVPHKTLALSTVFFSITSLLLIYTYSAHIFIASKNIMEFNREMRSKSSSLSSKNLLNHSIKYLYSRMKPRVIFLFWCFQGALLLSVILFMFSAYVYFYRSCF